MIIENVNKILLYIFIILLLFCTMYILFYSDQNISFNDNLDNIDIIINKYKQNNVNNVNNVNNKETFSSLSINSIIYNIVNNSLYIDNTLYNITNTPEVNRTTSSILSISDEISNRVLSTTPQAPQSQVTQPQTPIIYDEKSSMLDTPQGWRSATNSINSEWIILDLGSVTKNISGVITQGRGVGYPSATIKLQSVTSYTVQYSDTDTSTWIDVDNGNVFTANTPALYTRQIINNKICNLFKTPIIARYIKIIPKSYLNSISMRVGILISYPPYYSDKDGLEYLQKLTDFNNYIVNNKNNLINVIATVENAKAKSIENNLRLVKSITNLYYKQYLDYINKINAEVYNQSKKSMTPKKQKI